MFTAFDQIWGRIQWTKHWPLHFSILADLAAADAAFENALSSLNKWSNVCREQALAVDDPSTGFRTASCLLALNQPQVSFYSIFHENKFTVPGN